MTAVLDMPRPAPVSPPEFGGAALTATAPSSVWPLGGRYRKLALQGDDLGDFTGTGKKYWVSGKRLSHDDGWAGEVTRSGEWFIPAARNGEETVFTLDPYAALSKHMVGWHLQPDINAQVFLPIRAVDTNANTVTVSGRYEALAGEMQAPVSGGGEPEPEPEDPVFVPNRFRIFAPPGTVTVGPAAGCVAVMGPHRQAHWVNAVSTRCLYKGYRYETPLAGVQGSEPGSGITHRQDGLNFGGLYYTLHRHYDPVLMRFTTPDPIAADFYNLFAYAANNPARYCDPDGLDWADIWRHIKRGDIGGAAKAYWDDAASVGGNIKSNVNYYNDVGWDQYAGDFGTATAGYACGAADTVGLGDTLEGGFKSLGVNTDSQHFAYGRLVGTVSAAVVETAMTGGASAAARWGARGLLLADAAHAGKAAASGDWGTAALTMVGHGAGRALSRMSSGVVRSTRQGATLREVARDTRRFFYDNRAHSTISRQFWRSAGGANGRSLHHWMLPQRAKWLPQGIRNAGWNRFVVGSQPRIKGLNLNSYMGFAPRWGGSHAALARTLDCGLRVGIPSSLTAAGIWGYLQGAED
jgi:RHS repeat-associated protein